MDHFRRSGLAIVIEPRADLADAMCDLLNDLGYAAISAPTHAAGAARAHGKTSVELLAATVPAPDESRSGIYLEEAAKKNPLLAVVLMLSDTLEESEGAPDQAVRIVKPFGRHVLIEAILLSEKKVRGLA